MLELGGVVCIGWWPWTPLEHAPRRAAEGTSQEHQLALRRDPDPEQIDRECRRERSDNTKEERWGEPAP